jgi:hypothetical protein
MHIKRMWVMNERKMPTMCVVQCKLGYTNLLLQHTPFEDDQIN